MLGYCNAVTPGQMYTCHASCLYLCVCMLCIQVATVRSVHVQLPLLQQTCLLLVYTIS